MDFDDLYGTLKTDTKEGSSIEKPNTTSPVTLYESNTSYRHAFAVPNEDTVVDILNLPTKGKPQVVNIESFDDLVRSIFEEA